MDKTMLGHVTSSIKDGICTVEFFHPSHNSLPSAILSKLAETIRLKGKSNDVKLIVLKSGGDRTFCAGASFDELVSIRNKEDGHKFFMGFANVIDAIRTCGKIVIGRVQGKAVGGGVGLAAAVDYCMATKYSLVKLSELAIGIGPFVIGPAVQRKIGVSQFTAMAINAKEWYEAKWAKSVGLYHDVFDTTEQMDDYIERFTATLAEMNPVALSRLKKVFWEGTDRWPELMSQRAAISGELVLSDFTKDTLAAILNKTA